MEFQGQLFPSYSGFLLFTLYVVFGKWLSLFQPQFPHLWNEDDSSGHLIGLL